MRAGWPALKYVKEVKCKDQGFCVVVTYFINLFIEFSAIRFFYFPHYLSFQKYDVVCGTE